VKGEQVRAWEGQCIQEQPPFCQAACPIHVDVRAMIDCIRNSDFKAGFGLLSRLLFFPGILSRICDHPCEAYCKRREVGDSLRVGALERACATYGGPAPARSIAPPNGKRVAVAGGGLSGLTTAAELAAKGYKVVLFEEEPALLPRIRAFDTRLISPETIDEELALLEQFDIEVRVNAAADDVPALGQAFDAVYAGLGSGKRTTFRIGHINPDTLATEYPNIFAGGSFRSRGGEYSPVTSVQDGKTAAISIDRFLQGASLTAARPAPGPFETRLYTNTAGILPATAVQPADPLNGYSKAEAIREAGRCFPCGCLECVKSCEYLAYYKSYPKRYVRQIYNNLCIVLGDHPSNRMINSCTLCELCAEVCPEKFNMAQVCVQAREDMVAKGKMPPSAHDFALRDMSFSTSELFTLARHEPGLNSSAAVFFPGCQLCASSPDQVFGIYQHLRRNLPGGVGLMLGCCGAPARWAGRPDQFAAVLENLTAQWSSLGRPRLITACSSCYRTLAESRPDMPIESLWSVLAAVPLPGEAARPRRLAIHDPCSTRHYGCVGDGVRRLLGKLAVEIEELDGPQKTTCCGYGGLVRFANPAVAEKIVAKRIAQSPTDYVTYCAMCRDSFARQGKRALHVLDLMFPQTESDPAARPDPGFSWRRENRARLKRRVLAEIWSEPMPDQPQTPIEISPQVRELLERRMILIDDARAVIEHAEATGEKLEMVATGHLLAFYRPASVTFWVEYSVTENGFVVHNAYSHRMQVG